MTGKSEQDMDQSNERDLGLTVTTRKMLLPDFGNFKSSSESAGRSCLGRV